MTSNLAVESVVAAAPKHWRVESFRRHATPGEETNCSRSLDLLSLRSSDGMLAPRTDEGGLGRQAPAEGTISRYWAVLPGDLVVNPMWLIGGGVGVTNVTGAVSPDYRVYKLGSDIHPRFLHHLLRSRPYMEQYRLYTRAETTFDRRVSKEDFHLMPILVPPLSEQRRIAEFLDAETARIDVLNAARVNQRGLLRERYLSSVYDAISGSEERGSRRATGLRWLLTVPSSWPISPVSYQFEVVLGKMLNQERTQGKHLKPYLRNTNVQWDQILTDDLAVMEFPPDEQQRYRVLPGDLLICEGGEPGRAAIWHGAVGEIYYQKALHRVRRRGYSAPRWLYYCMRAATAQNVFAVEGNTTTIAHLTGEQLKAHRFPFPERPIQDRLVRDLDVLAEQQRRLANLLLKQEAKLKERRQALITAAVTGEIDVSTASGRGIGD